MWLDKAADRVEKWSHPVIKVLNGIGSSMALMMVLLVTVHVMSRAFFRKPLVGTVELEELMLVIMVFFGMAHAQMMKKHIAVDFFTSRLSEGVQNVLRCATTLLGVLVFLGYAWQNILLAQIYQNTGITTMHLRIPVYPFLWIVALGFFLMAVVLLSDFCRESARAVRDGKTPWVFASVSLVAIFVLLPFIQDIWRLAFDMKVAQFFALAALLVFLFSGTLIGAALAFVGFLGMGLFFGSGAGLGLLKTAPFSATASYALAVVPFFILMGEICFHSGLSEKLYRTAYRWVGQFRGGLSMATVLACGAFSAVSGSSLATAATMGTVALPEMRRYKYKDSLATGSIAAGGTIGILIPPSVMLIIYGVLVEVSIAELFFAGIIPGLISLLYYVIAIYILTRIYPDLGPMGPKTAWKDRVRSLGDTWEVLLLFVLVMGGIYGGYFTPTEAGAIGAASAFVIGVVRRRITKTNIVSSLLATGRTTSMVFMVVIGTTVYGYFLTSTQLPMQFAAYVVAIDVHRAVIIAAIIAACFIMGCVMGTLPLIFITVPIFAPVVQTLGYDLIWFGVVMCVVSEIGLITPPVGMNVFIMSGVANDVPLSTIFRGIIPFLIADVARLITLIAFPALTLFLPNLLR